MCRITLLFLFIPLALPLCAATDSYTSKAEAYLASLAARDQFAGAVLVATNGVRVFEKGVGLANREHAVPNTIATKFRIGSITKQFTAMCILILQQEGRLNVNDTISRYVEACPSTWNQITIAHLLNHTSGIPSFTEFEDNLEFERKPTTVKATLQRFIHKPLEFSPGSTFSYSNSGYVLLGYVIERVTGTPYERFLKDKILRPLGLNDTGYDHPAIVLPNRASGYSKNGDQVVNCVPFAMDTPHAAGALYSTVLDLHKWISAVHSERLVPRQALESMFTPFVGNYGKGWWERNGQYCYGWFRKQSGMRIQYEHPGSISGFQTDVIWLPKDQTYIAVLSNLEWADAEAIANHLLEMLP